MNMIEALLLTKATWNETRYVSV